ncbi:outer membrane beta-barrel protein [Shewanella sp. M16]|uniref:LysM peptidoglycan-binding domain-containing protein n=1 Tax=Shewanella sp. M16 TaxID=2830837 RepID=UPI001BAFD65E|nr:outer membrane beta-barrel protein [Shewanella sp. M16]
MMTINRFSTLCTLLMSLLAAQSFAQSIYIGAAGNVSANNQDDNSDTDFGAELWSGFHFNPYLSAELGYGLLGKDAQQQTLHGSTLQLIGRYPVSDYASLHLGAGAFYQGDDVIPAVSFGLQYKLSPAWSLDIGYKWLVNGYGSSINNASESDLYSLRIGVEYRFGSQAIATESKKSTQSSQVAEAKVETHSATSPSQALTAVELNYQQSVSDIDAINILDIKPCPKALHIVEYTIKEGDHLMQIARSFNISYQALMQANQQYTCCGRHPNVVHSGDRLRIPQLIDDCKTLQRQPKNQARTGQK